MSHRLLDGGRSRLFDAYIGVHLFEGSGRLRLEPIFTVSFWLIDGKVHLFVLVVSRLIDCQHFDELGMRFPHLVGPDILINLFVEDVLADVG